jgi:hypothetical protein
LFEYPPPDPEGRPHISIVFDFGEESELDLDDFGGAMATIRKRQLQLSDGVGVILFDDDGDAWVLIDAVVDRFNPQRDAGSCAWTGRRIVPWQTRVTWRSGAPTFMFDRRAY